MSARLIEVPPSRMGSATEIALGRVARVLRLDRAAVHEYLPGGAVARTSWAAAGIAPLGRTVEPGQFPWTTTRLARGEAVRVSRLADLPAEAAIDRRSHERAGTRSCLALPLAHGEGDPLGALFVDAVRAERAWPERLVQRLQLLGQVFATVLSRRRADLEVQQLRQDLAHVARVSTVGELTASLAHELSQPLTAILSNAQAAQHLLATAAPNLDEARAIVKDIVEDDQRAAAVIHRLRRLLRKNAEPPAMLDVSELVGEVGRLATGDAVVRGVRIRLALTPDLPLVRGDRVQLQQVLLNLILNGLDAMREAGAAGRELVLGTERDGGGGVLVWVRDAGCGIDPARLDRIFDAFYTTKAGGLGMGLAIARSIVQEHGGRLRAESVGSAGTTFSFTLPVDAA